MNIIYFFFTQHAIYRYNALVSVVFNGTTRESTDECYYTDVVSVKTHIAETTASKGERVYVDEFSIVNAGGDAITCSVASSEYPLLAPSIKAMRNLIKDKEQTEKKAA